MSQLADVNMQSSAGMFTFYNVLRLVHAFIVCSEQHCK